MGKTIKQIAEEIGVSKQAVMKKRKQEPLASQLAPFTSTIGGAIVMEEQGVVLIKGAFSQTEQGEVVVANRQPNRQPPTTRFRAVVANHFPVGGYATRGTHRQK